MARQNPKAQVSDPSSWDCFDPAPPFDRNPPCFSPETSKPKDLTFWLKGPRQGAFPKPWIAGSRCSYSIYHITPYAINYTLCTIHHKLFLLVFWSFGPLLTPAMFAEEHRRRAQERWEQWEHEALGHATFRIFHLGGLGALGLRAETCPPAK